MAPRPAKGPFRTNKVAHQLFERNLAAQPSKKIPSSSVPKGTKLAAGYHDRTKDRTDNDSDDRAKRIKALEEQVKEGNLDQETFEKLRDEITGGDISATHLVKGLDRKLLERVRRGEDVYSTAPKKDVEVAPPVKDVDEEFEELEQRAVAPVMREKVAKKGEFAPPPPIAGAKRSRDDILAELKASRKAAAEAAAAAVPSLGPRFRKIGAEKEPRIETDERGREVLVVVGEDGKVKRKVRKAKPNEQEMGAKKKLRLLEVDPNVKPLGIAEEDLPQRPAQQEEDDDDDIFGGVSEYNPLAGLEGDSDDGSESEIADGKQHSAKTKTENEETVATNDLKSQAVSGPRNYFGTSTTSEAVSEQPFDILKDPTILAAVKAAAKKAPAEGNNADDPEEAAHLKRRTAMLAATDRDMDDLDMGFGSNRFDDAEEGEDGERVRFSEWKGKGAEDDDEDDGESRERGGKKRKRAPKKRKGDKNNAEDVMRVLEGRRNNG